MKGCRLTLLGSLVVTLACTERDLPPEAYGIFELTNDDAFQTRINMASDGVTYVIASLLGMRSNPLTCRADVYDGLEASMELDLSCSGEVIPFSFEWRDSTEDWVVREDGSDPLIFERR